MEKSSTDSAVEVVYSVTTNRWPLTNVNRSSQDREGQPISRGRGDRRSRYPPQNALRSARFASRPASPTVLELEAAGIAYESRCVLSRAVAAQLWRCAF